MSESIAARAAMHAALGDPARLAIADALVVSDRSPKELAGLLDVPTNLLAHHLDVLERAGVIVRTPSAGDGRRRYVRLAPAVRASGVLRGSAPAGEMVFLCTHNSARSQLAAAMWRGRTGRPASSAGTDPAPRVHRGALAAARRAGLAIDGVAPSAIDVLPTGAQVVTVCDLVHEELTPEPSWWHWSIPDPVPVGDAAAFDAVVAELDARISAVVAVIDQEDQG